MKYVYVIERWNRKREAYSSKARAFDQVFELMGDDGRKIVGGCEGSTQSSTEIVPGVSERMIRGHMDTMLNLYGGFTIELGPMGSLHCFYLKVR